MSRMEDQKRNELEIVRLASTILQEKWSPQECESPDFIVVTPSSTFGLEVTECYAGRSHKKGSVLAQEARHRQKIMDEIRVKAIEAHPHVAEWGLSFFGPWSDHKGVARAVMEALEDEIAGVDRNLSIPPLEENADFPSLGALPSVLVSKRAHPLAARQWRYMADHAGGVETCSGQLQAAIDAKAPKVLSYRNKCNEVRLLVSAFSLKTSGNVSVDSSFLPNLRGFDIVYFLFIPLYVVEYPSGSVATLSGHTPTSLSARPPIRGENARLRIAERNNNASQMDSNLD